MDEYTSAVSSVRNDVCDRDSPKNGLRSFVKYDVPSCAGALDGWDCQAPMRFDWAMFAGSSLARSAAFLSFIYTQAESCSRSFVHARLVVEPVETHPQVSPLALLGGQAAHRWAV